MIIVDFFHHLYLLSILHVITTRFLLFQTLTLHFVVLSFDRYSRDDVIGEVMLELEHVDLKESEQNPVPISKEITPRSFKVNKRDYFFCMNQEKLI